MNALAARQSSHAIDPDMLARWSPRALSGEALPEADLLTILEAGRWAPSAFNAQPWHFIHARRDTPAFADLLGLLNPFNQDWAKEAGALVFIASSMSRLDSKGLRLPTRSHAFDAGAAWGLMALQATKLGWHAHAMGGFDHDRAMQTLGVPEDWRLEVAVAIGRQGDPAILPEGLRAREAPSPRKPLSEIASEGRFGS